MKRRFSVIITAFFIVILLSACGKTQIDNSINSSASNTETVTKNAEKSVTEQITEKESQPAETTAKKMLRIDVNGNTLYADFEDNSSANALKEQLLSGSITLNMEDYGGFEKVGDLPFSLVTNDEQITTEPGDVILYQGNKLTIYYDTNSWNFTKVAKIRNSDSSLKTMLGDGSVNVKFSLEDE